jgi:hypothetical protein
MGPDKEDRRILGERASATALERDLETALPPLRGMRWLLVTLLLAAVGGCAYAAFALNDPMAASTHTRTYLQSLAIGLASGIVTFTALPVVLSIAKRARNILLAIGAVVGAAGVAEAYWIDDDLWQAVVMETGLAILLVVALDLLIAHALHAISKREARLRTNLAKARKAIESADSELDYKYAMHDYLGLPRPDQIPTGPDWAKDEDSEW